MIKHIIITLLLVLLAFPVNADKPLGEITFNATEYNFGAFSKKLIRRVVFVFTNTGKSPVIIQSADASCGCTHVSYSSKPVNPGKKGYLTVYYDGTKIQPGHFTKTIDVKSNAQTSIVRLTISGTTSNN